MVSADDVLGCLKAVEEKYPGFLAQVINSEGVTHRFVKLFVNQEPIAAQALDTTLEASDRLEIIAAIAGG